MFVGRENELGYLNKAYKSNEAKLIALYGRRRIGKTQLLREFCKNKKCVFYSAIETSDGNQLSLFYNEILKQSTMKISYQYGFKNWIEAFDCLSEISKSERVIVVIDEFPYMVKENKSIPSILQNLWDSKISQSNLMIVLSGSSISFMEDEILSAASPLYGRFSFTLPLYELNYKCTNDFFKNYSTEDKIIATSILGGVPYNLLAFNSQCLLAENIESTILSIDGKLHDEVNSLIRQELKKPSIYNTIIQAIAAGNTQFNQIESKSGLSNSSLTTYLNKLINIKLIKKEYPFDYSPNQKASVTKGLYEVSDSLFNFYYRFCFNNSSALSITDIHSFFELIVKPHLHEYASKTFENICINYMYYLNNLKRLPSFFTTFSRWWGNVDHIQDSGKKNTTSEEIDIMSKSYDDKIMIVGECKFRNSKFSYTQYKQLQNKINDTKHEVYYYLFSLSGFEESLCKETKNNNNLRLISADELYKD